MARSTSAAHAPSFGERIRAFFVTSGVMAAAAALCLIALALAAALLSYHEADPSFDTVTGAAPQNWMGAPGAWVVNLLFQLFRSEEHTSELQSLMRISYAVFCLKKKNRTTI